MPGTSTSCSCTPSDARTSATPEQGFARGRGPAHALSRTRVRGLCFPVWCTSGVFHGVPMGRVPCPESAVRTACNLVLCPLSGAGADSHETLRRAGRLAHSIPAGSQGTVTDEPLAARAARGLMLQKNEAVMGTLAWGHAGESAATAPCGLFLQAVVGHVQLPGLRRRSAGAACREVIRCSCHRSGITMHQDCAFPPSSLSVTMQHPYVPAHRKAGPHDGLKAERCQAHSGWEGRVCHTTRQFLTVLSLPDTAGETLMSAALPQPCVCRKKNRDRHSSRSIRQRNVFSEGRPGTVLTDRSCPRETMA